MGFLDPKVWLAIALAAALGFVAGYGQRYLNSVSKADYEKVVKTGITAQSALDAITEQGKKQEADNVQRIALLTRQIAASDVNRAAAEVQRDNANKDLETALAKNRALLHSISLPGFVRDLYSGNSPGQGISLTANPGGVRPAPGSSAPVAADQFIEVCILNKNDQNALAERYKRLYSYTQNLWNTCNRKD
jgi:hypothetical protein